MEDDCSGHLLLLAFRHIVRTPKISIASPLLNGDVFVFPADVAPGVAHRPITN